jgi:hypothetical protein
MATMPPLEAALDWMDMWWCAQRATTDTRLRFAVRNGRRREGRNREYITPAGKMFCATYPLAAVRNGTDGPQKEFTMTHAPGDLVSFIVHVQTEIRVRIPYM